jgi:hypothetical protein
MRKNLAIKGHPTRGKEVIELLEMLGGHNVCRLNGREQLPHWVADNNYICNKFSKKCKDILLTFTLEEFLEKYPYKVGDRVVYTKFGDNYDDYPVIIDSMKWTGTTIEYTFNDCVTCLAKDLEMWKGNPDAVISGIYLNSCDYADEVELYLGDYEIEVRDGKTYAVLKKSKYPTTYKECCDVLKIPNDECYIDIDVPLDYNKLLSVFTELLICRKAYYKIYGEQMGLGKPWEPDWSNDDETKFCIYTTQNIISLDIFGVDNRILAFPTEEMRDAFYENFKKEIEQCKELL